MIINVVIADAAGAAMAFITSDMPVILTTTVVLVDHDHFGVKNCDVANNPLNILINHNDLRIIMVIMMVIILMMMLTL